MRTKDISIRAPHGLHLRVAAQIVKEVQGLKSTVLFQNEAGRANASSILELLVLGGKEGSTVKVTALGEDEKRALDKVTEILMDGAGI